MSPAAHSGAQALRLDRLEVALGRGRTAICVIHPLSLTLRPGELTIVIGPNGAGKTTLLRALAGLVPTKGSLWLGARDLAGWTGPARGQTIAYLAQGGRVHWPIPVRDIVALGRLPFAGPGGRLGDADRRIVDQAIEACCIGHLALRPATALSGGERARVLLARALAVRAPVLLVDEPAASLDPAHQVAIMAMLGRECAAGRIVVAVLHDLSLVAAFAKRVIVLADGRVVADGPASQVFAGDVLDRVFGVALLRAEVNGSLLVAPATGAAS
jgi:iron complex transport system ATP-binding protein